MIHKAYLNAKRYNHTLNPRTFVTIIISIISCYVVIHFDIRIHQDLMFFGLIISFPVVFSLQSAFERRDRALEYLSKFRAGLVSSFRCMSRLRKLSYQEKLVFRERLSGASETLLLCLKDEDRPLQEAYSKFNEVYKFLEENREKIAVNIHTRVVRFMYEVEESAGYLLSLREHRTITLLRVFAFIFINLFPFLQASLLNATLGNILPTFVIYLASALTSLTLISMYNIQVQLEYPFDQIGPDDIHIGDYVFDKAAIYTEDTIRPALKPMPPARSSARK